MTDAANEFRPLVLRAKTLGRALLQVYQSDADSIPADLIELLDIAEQRLGKAGYLDPDGPSASHEEQAAATKMDTSRSKDPSPRGN